MENSDTKTAKVFTPTHLIRWYKPNYSPILQQFWSDHMGGGEWRNVETVREL